jgi:hypothetical protein
VDVDNALIAYTSLVYSPQLQHQNFDPTKH